MVTMKRVAWLLSLAAGSTVAQDSSSSSSSSSGTCEADVSLATMATFDFCSDFCDSYEPCVVLDSSAIDCAAAASGSGEDSSACTLDGNCAVSCVAYSSYQFTVYIPFGAYQSEEEQAARALDNDSYNSDLTYLSSYSSSGYYYLNDDLLDAIGTLAISPYATSVSIAGGRSMYSFTKSKVANVTLEKSFLADQTQVTDVGLYSLDLTDQMDGLAALLPSTLSSLTLTNTLLYDFPWTLLEDFPDLSSLTLSYSYIAEVVPPSSDSSLTSLTGLSMTYSEIAEFDASAFPNLETLYLSNSNLTEIPASIANLKSLTSLSIVNSAITSIDSRFSSDTLTTLDLTSNALTTFDASFPNLESLSLGANYLTEIPESVFECTKLSSLSIYSNPLTLNLTSAQVEFLRKISYLSIPTLTNATWDCTVGELNGVAVCITDAENTANTTNTSDEDGGSDTAAIIGGVVGGLVALALVIAAIAFLIYRKRGSERSTDKNYEPIATPAAGSIVTDTNDLTGTGASLLSSSALLAADAKLMPLQLNPRELQDIRMIGEGSASIFWLVRYRRDTLLASKRLKTDDVRRESVASFVREIKLVSTLDHPSIVKLAGISYRPNENGDSVPSPSTLQALFEYIDNGSLRDYLTNPGVPRTWHAEKLEVAIDIADALVYLHSLTPPVLHRDLRSSNVLLTNDMRGKLSSFRCAKRGEEADSIRDTLTLGSHGFGGSGRGETLEDSGVSAARWVAPEVLASSSDHGEAADMYSFGVMLIEMDSHGLPFDDSFSNVSGSDRHARVVDERAVLQRIVAGELQPAFGMRCPPALATLGLQCLDRNPWNRPSSPDVAYKLRQVLKTLGPA